MTLRRSDNMSPASSRAELGSLHIEKPHSAAELMKASTPAGGPGHD